MIKLSTLGGGVGEQQVHNRAHHGIVMDANGCVRSFSEQNVIEPFANLISLLDERYIANK